MGNFVSWSLVVLSILMPFVVFALVVHALERISQRQLAQRFGWKSVMWTGWLGTPIHEMSHVVMCLLFRHRIHEVAFFEPDEKSGRLGYVRHSCRKKSWFEELGNPFIAIAPLMGGSAVLLILINVFYGGLFEYQSGGTGSLGIQSVPDWLDSVANVLGSVFRPEHFASLKFWVFNYLVICVGSHMAPSRSDYQGAGRGGLILAGFLVATTITLSALMQPPADLIPRIAELLSPLFAMFLTIGLLLSFVTLIISLFVQLFPQRFRVSSS